MPSKRSLSDLLRGMETHSERLLTLEDLASEVFSGNRDLTERVTRAWLLAVGDVSAKATEPQWRHFLALLQDIFDSVSIPDRIAELIVYISTAYGEGVDISVFGNKRIKKPTATMTKQALADILDRTKGIPDYLDQVKLKTAQALSRSTDRSFGNALMVTAPFRNSFPGFAGSVSNSVNEAAAMAVIDTAKLNDKKILWVAERDACLHCLAHAGLSVSPGDLFPDVSFARKKLDRVSAPPLHYFCRCHIIMVSESGANTFGPVLQREATRSVVRGFTDKNQSLKSRLTAVDDLISQGVQLPKSVIAYGRRAVKQGSFPEIG